MDSQTKPENFTLKMWTLVSVLAFNVMLLMICTVYADKLIVIAIKNSKEDRSGNEEDVAKASRAVMIIIFLIVTGFAFLFIYGVLKKKLCLCTTYAVLSVMVTVGIIGHAISQPMLWVNAFIAIAISAVAILYVQDLRSMPRNAYRNKRFQLA